MDQLQKDQRHKVDVAAYDKSVQKLKIKPNFLMNTVWAFMVGGLICVIGQFITNFYMTQGLAKTDAGTATVVTLVFLGAFFTGLGIYDELGKRAGAGSIIPITGFANSIVAAAMDYKNEGFIFGVGARLFQIAGPVLVYGFVASTVIGLVAWILSKI
ncbi:MAG: stage V sporulation protein AC [Ignavibacteriales bacterium]